MPLPTSPLVPLVLAAIELGRPYSAIYAQVIGGALPAERHGARWFIHRDTVNRLLQEQRATAAQIPSGAVA